MMKKIKAKLFAIILPIFGLLFGSLILTPVSPAYAVPENNNDVTAVEETTTEEQANQENDQSSNQQNQNSSTDCHSQAGPLGWRICPLSGTIAKAVDSIYGLIEHFLVIQPISTDNESPIYQVWVYIRDITNIVFILLILVIIYSQITGVGLSNYNIKKTLPRIIIAAVLVNLSYIICSAAVDISNIIGASLNGFFTSIGEKAAASSGVETFISWGTIVAFLFGSTGTIMLTQGIITGGGAALWMLLPVIISGIISIVVGLATIVMRQALVVLLVMISPLAFVAYLLPNTESWFKKWKDLFIAMLVFYPMFSVLFGASKLAGWAIIASAQNAFWVILGMAVQVVPLFFSIKLMNSSKTFLGKVNEKLNSLGNGARNASRDFAAEKRDIRKNRFYHNQIKNRPNATAARLAISKAKQISKLSDSKENLDNITSQRLNELRDGKRIIGIDKNGKPIYKTTVSTPEMRREYQRRVNKLAAANAAASVENHMGTIGDYMKETGIEDETLTKLSKEQAANYIESQTLASAARRNDRADKRYYFTEVAKAAKRNKKGEIIDKEAYNRLIVQGAGADAFSDDIKIRRDATTTVIADAYDMFEAERKITTSKYTTYLDKQVSAEVDKVYDQMLADRNIDGIVAAQNITAKRGDYDKIFSKLSKAMDQEYYTELDTDFANTLALNLLSMKDASPNLGRLGKHINVETARYMNGDRTSKYVTMKEFFTGYDSDGGKTKFNAQVLMQGTSLKGIDRTFYTGLSEGIDTYLADDTDARNLIFTNMTPQLISAIGTFSSGSEQLQNSMNFITGAKYDSASDSWSIKPGQTPQQTEDYTFRTRKYLSFLTAQNVIDMKTDTFNAIITRLADNIGDTSKDRSSAKQEFYNILDNRGIIDQIRQTADTNPGLINGMRPGIRKTLGF